MKSPIDTIYEQVEAERLLEITLTRLNARILGYTLGFLCATGLFLACLVLLIKGGPAVGKNLNLLGNFFPFFSVDWVKLPLALLYGFAFGFVSGYTISRVYNSVTRAGVESGV